MNTSRPISKSRPSGAIPLLASIAVAAEAALPFAAHAATGVTVDSVTQRWPWNDKLDITYTVTGGQDVASGQYCKIVFTTVIDGTTYTIDGTTDIPASAANGTHTITWDAPEGVRRTDCTMSAAVYATDVPSGDDYMVIDLNTGVVTWEGMLASQAASNARYNTDTYKTTKMVLRKVPKTADSASLPNGPFTSGYPTGDADHTLPNNLTSTPRTWTTDRDYYIGVFPVTQYQSRAIWGSWDPSQSKTAIEGNTVDHRPAETVSWGQLRGSIASTASISTIDTFTGDSPFFQRLMWRTGNKFAFDLPTEVMFEIAERAGSTTYYYWGDAMDTSYVVCSENSGGSTVAVGSRLPNAWGLYDTCGNVFEIMRDEYSAGSNLANNPDAFTPSYFNTNRHYAHGGGAYSYASTSDRFHSSMRESAGKTDEKYITNGFRVSYVRQ